MKKFFSLRSKKLLPALLVLLAITIAIFGGLKYRHYNTVVLPKRLVDNVLSENVELLDTILLQTRSWTIAELSLKTESAIERVRELAAKVVHMRLPADTVDYLRSYLNYSRRLLESHLKMWEGIDKYRRGASLYSSWDVEQALKKFDESWTEVRAIEVKIAAQYEPQHDKQDHYLFFTKHMEYPFYDDLRLRIMFGVY